MEAMASLPAGGGLIAAACDALGMARATVYRHRARRPPHWRRPLPDLARPAR